VLAGEGEIPVLVGKGAVVVVVDNGVGFWLLAEQLGLQAGSLVPAGGVTVAVLVRVPVAVAGAVPLRV
jgi:hypothetical protein